MKKYLLTRINLIIILVIIIGFSSITFTNYYNYSNVIKDNIQNISKLTSSNIYAEINNLLTKPIFVSLTMANDTFLKSWLNNEQAMLNNEEYTKKLQDYLLAFQKQYNYNSVFLVSTQSNLYYHYNGILKTVNEKTPHDDWYYDLINSKKNYMLDIDWDEADNNILTIFINCKVEDSNGNLIGVVGVGIKMDQLQSILNSYKNDFGLNAFLINSLGDIQVHTDKNLIGNKNLFDYEPLKKHKNDILNNLNTWETYWYNIDNRELFLTTKYIDELDWYIAIEKDNDTLRSSFKNQIIHDLIILLIILGLVLTASTYLIMYYKRIMTNLVSTDELTGLANRRVFNESLSKIIENKKQNHKDTYIFIFDVDHFKAINDEKGHLFGDYVLKKIGCIVSKTLGSSGLISRWGGDEFCGIIYKNESQSKDLILKLVNEVYIHDEFKKNTVTISVGATAVLESDTVDTLLARADTALYLSKENGRNQATFL